MRTPILEAFYLICPYLNSAANDYFLDGARQGFDGESVESIADSSEGSAITRPDYGFAGMVQRISRSSLDSWR